MAYQPTIPTVIFISLFLLVYLVVLLKNTTRNTIDLYDFLILSSIAIVPAIFVFFPRVVVFLARLSGVEFPFVLLFGGLFLIVFTYFYRLIIEINHHRSRIVLLLQEVSILRQKLQQQKLNNTEQEE